MLALWLSETQLPKIVILTSFDGESWMPSRKNFMFPAKALSRVFWGKFINYLRKAFVKGKLIFPGQIAHLAVEGHSLQSINRLWDKDRVVYSKAPFKAKDETARDTAASRNTDTGGHWSFHAACSVGRAVDTPGNLLPERKLHVRNLQIQRDV